MKILILSILVSMMSSLGAIAQEVIGTAGNSKTIGTTNVNFTIGEPIISTGSVGAFNVTQGFQQAYVLVNSVEEKKMNPNLSISIYPNPTSDIVHILPQNFKEGVFSAQLFSMDGKVLRNESFEKEGLEMSVSNLQSGNYILIITNPEENYYHNFKLVKSH